MKTSEIYRKFIIPPNLQEHMLRVCGVAMIIKEHWQSEALDWELIKTACLLHDLGNIVRFDFDKTGAFLDGDKAKLEYWKKVQREIVDKYGTDDHEVTRKILLAVGADKKVIDVISQKSFGNSVKIRTSNEWPLKILSYADLRTLPNGIGTLEERIADIKQRMPKYVNRPDFADLVAACQEIEKEIQKKVGIPVMEINNQFVSDKVGKERDNWLDLET